MKLEPLMLDLIFNEKLIITFVQCTKSSVEQAYKKITNDSIIFTSVIVRGNMIVLLVDTTADLLAEDLEYIEDLVYSVPGVINLRHRVECIDDKLSVFPKITLSHERY